MTDRQGSGNAPDRYTPAPAAPIPLVTVANVMRPPPTTADTNDPWPRAAYLMKHARATALLVLDAHTGQLKGILTEADIAHAVAGGKDLNEVWIGELMTIRPTVINPATSVRDAAQVMTRGHFRHLPVSGSTGLAGIIDLTDICRVMTDPDASRRSVIRNGGGARTTPGNGPRTEPDNLHPLIA